MLQSKRCVILLDGIDEVTNDIEFHATVNEIRGLVSRYPGNKFVITSRYSGWRGGLGSSFEQYDVKDLNSRQVKEFIESWCSAIEQNRGNILGLPKTNETQEYRKSTVLERASNLLSALNRNSSIRKLAENPLLLSIICYVHYQKALPEERISLYQKCSELLIDQWDREKGLTLYDTKLTSARKEAVIEEIAFALHSQKIGKDTEGKEFTAGEVIPIVQKLLVKFRMDPATANELFEKLVNRSGIIISVEKFKNKYAFSHLTFQEYYTARYLSDNNLDIFEAAEKSQENSLTAFSGWWREVLLLYSALQRDATWIIKQLSRNHQLNLTKANLQIAAQAIQEAVSISTPAVENNILTQLYKIRLANKPYKDVSAWSPEIRQYLINYGTSERFSSDALKFVTQNAENGPLTEKFMISLTRLLDSSVDTSVILNSIDSLIKLGPKSRVVRKLPTSILERLLAFKNPEIQLETVYFILQSFPEPSYKVLREKAIQTLLETIPEKLIKNTTLDSQQLIKAIEITHKRKSKATRRAIQDKFATILYNTLQQDDIDFPLCQTVAESLLKIESSNLQSLHKQQLKDMLLYGNEKKQWRAIELLASNFGSDHTIVDVIIAQLESPLISVRRRALDVIRGELKLNDQQLTKTIAMLRRGKKRRPLLSEPYYRFLESIVGKGFLGMSQSECAYVTQCLIQLEPLPNHEVCKYLIYIYKKLSGITRWWLIDRLNTISVSKINVEVWTEIILFYEKDQKEEKNWDADSHSDAMGALLWIARQNIHGLRDKVISLLIEDTKNADEVISINAFLALTQIKVPIERGSELYFLICKRLLSKRQDISDRALDILIENHLT